VRETLIRQSDAQSSVPIVAVDAESLETVLTGLGETAKVWCRANGYSAKPSSFQLVPGLSGDLQAVLFGVDSGGDADPFSLGSLANALPSGDYHLADAFPGTAEASLAFALSSYKFDRYSSSSNKKAVRLCVPSDVDLGRLSAVLDGVQLARDLINTPANDLGPEELASAVETLFMENGGSGQITVGDDLLKHGFPMVHAVGRASSRAPRIADYSWGAEDAPRVTLVGKGVIFDTGG
jgi:leucyl aminopeptidase